MGFFKDARKGMSDAKKMGDYHGGMPSMRGAFKDISAMADDRGEDEVLKTGIPARGVVKGFAEPVQGDRFAMHIPIEVHPREGEPYQVDYVFPTTRMKAAISAGALPIRNGSVAERAPGTPTCIPSIKRAATSCRSISIQ